MKLSRSIDVVFLTCACTTADCHDKQSYVVSSLPVWILYHIVNCNHIFDYKVVTQANYSMLSFIPFYGIVSLSC